MKNFLAIAAVLVGMIPALFPEADAQTQAASEPPAEIAGLGENTSPAGRDAALDD